MPIDYPERKTKNLKTAVFQTLHGLHQTLKGIIDEQSNSRPVIVVFDSDDSYKHYVSSLYPEVDIEAISTSGTFIDLPGNRPHLVLSDRYLSVTEAVLAGELARMALKYLPLPIWLSEGLAMMAEQELAGMCPPAIDAKSLQQLSAFWTSDNVQQLWDGSGFYQLDETGDIFRMTAQLMIHALSKLFSPETCRNFIRHAYYRDAGDNSALEHLGISIGDLLMASLGIEE